MTRVSVFGQDDSLGNKRPIELVHYLNDVGLHPADRKVTTYDNVCLLGKPVFDGSLDLIMCWNNQRKFRFLYLGHWNDGVVE